MPRYATVNILNWDLLKMPVSVVSKTQGVNFNNIYTNLPKDIQLSWDNDLVFDKETGDYKVVSGAEALAQRLYLRLSVQKGRDHTDKNFGWDFEYVIDKPENLVQEILPVLLDDFVSAIMEDEYVVDVQDASAELIRMDEQTSEIRLYAVVIPKPPTEPFPIGISLI